MRAVGLACCVVAVISLFGPRISQAVAADDSDELPPIVTAYDLKRYGTPGFSFVAPGSWQELSGDSAKLARLQFVAVLREVLDEPPDVPPRVFRQLASFTCFWIPEINGYLIASMIQAATFPVRLLDVLHVHGKGSNDWGESFYLTVEETTLNERFSLDGEPALAIDVRMSGRLSIATLLFRVPGQSHLIGGLAMLLPADSGTRFQPLVDHIRNSVHIVGVEGIAVEPATIDIETANHAVVMRELVDIDPDKPGFQPGYIDAEPVFLRPALWAATDESSAPSTVSLVATRLLIIAIAYGIAFFVSMRIAYMIVMVIGGYFMSEKLIASIRESAEESSLTMGLFNAPWLIMVCAGASMLIAALTLALFLRL